MSLPWKDATLSQLYCIAYDDPMALPIHRRQALEEIRRRMQRRKKARTQYKVKAVLPK